MMVANGMTPYDVDDILKRRSLYQDFSNRSLIKLGLEIPEFSPETAGKILSEIIRKNDFSLYEYFQTDFFGHRKSLDDKIRLIENLDRMLLSFIKNSDPDKDTILITSDHGNLEDQSSRQHTLNGVPLIIWGKKGEKLIPKIDSLADITPQIVAFLN